MAIESSELVTEVYGFWPRFEGAYILAATIESHSELFYELGDRTLTLLLHWWLGAPDHYDGGPIAYSTDDLHRQIRIAFAIDEITLHTFHCSNMAIEELLINETGIGTMSCSGGFEASFSYDSVRVLDVIPCDETGRSTSA